MSYTLVNPGLHEKQLHRIPDRMGNFAGVVLRAQATMLFSRQGLSDSTTVLAEELAQTLSCARVSVGLVERRLINIIGTCQARHVDRISLGPSGSNPVQGTASVEVVGLVTGANGNNTGAIGSAFYDVFASKFYVFDNTLSDF